MSDDRRVSFAQELRESGRVAPRVWSIVGVALILGLASDKFVWVALALWLVFVFPLAVGGLARWAMREIMRSMVTSGKATVVTRRPAAAASRERVVTGRVISSQ